MEHINDILVIINQGHTRNETLSAILNNVLDFTGMENGGIYLKDSATGNYSLSVYRIDNEKPSQKKNIQYNWEFFIPILKDKILAIPDITEYYSDTYQHPIVDSGCVSFIGIPLIQNDENLGILVASGPDPREFPEVQKRMYSYIGKYIAGHIHHLYFVEDLKKSKEMYYDLFYNAQDIIYTHDLEGNFLSMNQAGLDLLGYSWEEIVQLKGRDLMTEESLETAFVFLQQIIHNENISVQPVLEVVNKHGDKLFLEFNMRPIMENGKPVAVHGIARDVNKRLQAEKNMLIFPKAINLATDGIDFSDADHKIQFINEAGARLFGYSRRELLGQHADIFYAEEDLPNLMENVIPAMEKYGYWNGLILGRKKDGSVIPVEISLSSIMDQNGKPLANIGVFREKKSTGSTC